jgi:hypothetical protein
MAATVEVRSVRVGARSTLYVSRDGALYRHYHDTDAWDGPLTPRVDAGGVSRCDGNRSLAAVVRCAFDEERFRGASEGDAPAHLLNALRCLVRSADVDELARRRALHGLELRGARGDALAARGGRGGAARAPAAAARTASTARPHGVAAVAVGAPRRDARRPRLALPARPLRPPAAGAAVRRGGGASDGGGRRIRAGEKKRTPAFPYLSSAQRGKSAPSDTHTHADAELSFTHTRYSIVSVNAEGTVQKKYGPVPFSSWVFPFTLPAL